MMFGPLAFLSPWLLAGLVTLPVIYWLLRAVPPRPAQISFPPTRILVGIENDEKTADTTPWWLTLIRLLVAALVIFALADPVLNPQRDAALKGSGPVVIMVDNGWSASTHWAERARMIERLIAEAEGQSRPVVVLPTAVQSKGSAPKIEAPGDARKTAAALIPLPFAPDRAQAVTALETILNVAGANAPAIVWLHDGIDHKGVALATAERLLRLAGNGSLAVIDESAGEQALAVLAKTGDKGKLDAVVLSPSGSARTGTLHAVSARGERLAEATFQLAAGETSAVQSFDLPLELRNQVARVEIAGERSAGAVNLIDASTQWHRVGLISGESREQAQPLLAPLYYIQKALAPFAELAISREPNLDAGLDIVLKQNVSVVMLADIGTVSGGAEKRLTEFLKRGGVLVRFAGSRLEKGGDDSLLPVPLRAGGRSLGGALSWSTPQQLAPFGDDSPFNGIAIPEDVKINRQVLADPSRLGANVEVWARLKDGTPLVTAARQGEGRIVLFHITANSDWSSLPISGLFVDMLRRVATMGVIGASNTGADGADASAGAASDAAPDAQSVMPPLRTLDGVGLLKAPPATAEPITSIAFPGIEPSLAHPPGFYGAGSAPRALNIATAATKLAAMPSLPNQVQRLTYENAASVPLKPWLLAIALALLFADIIAIVLLQAGGLAGLTRRRAARATMLAVGILSALAFAPLSPAGAQSSDTGRKPVTPEMAADVSAQDATGKVTFGYVVSGDRDTDEASRLGLIGLAKVLSTRTAVEPGKPMPVDIANDEIAFYPILYWPVIDTTETLNEKAIAKIDAYMKEGGLIIFDTRDYAQGGGNMLPLAGKGGNALQRLLGKLDVPRLEPVPENHVVTKSFYLLRSFPGRWDGGQLWVEAIPESGDDTRKARVSDGVTSIMITSNDFAAAWALDQTGRPIYPVAPGGEMQREMAFRAGVNIVMHALTGNYKADQVHVPALLERLGQ